MTADAELAASALAAYHRRLADITAEQNQLLSALASLRGTGVTGDAFVGIQARLAQLNQEREQAEEGKEKSIPQRSHAQARADFLRKLFMVRYWVLDPDTETIELSDDRIPSVGGVGADDLITEGDALTLAKAAALLEVSAEELESMDLPITRGESYRYETADGVWETDVALDTVRTVDVVECLLAKMPRDRIRRLLHDLDAVVKVTRGRTREDIKARVPKVPLAERVYRVYLELLGTVQVRTDVTKLKTSS